MAAPPAPPPDVPTLSSFQPNGGGEDPSAFSAAALPKLFFNAEQALDEIAAVVPAFSKDIDMIKGDLREVLRQAIPRGASSSKTMSSSGGSGLPIGGGLVG
jgi:hypothetical protein